MPAPEVHRLIAALAAGDRGALQELYRLSSPKLYGIALRILRHSDLAAEALGETYRRILKQADTLTPREDAVCWMAAIARASALDLARSRETIAPFETFEAGEPAEDPLRRAGHSPALRRLLACLGTLSEERRRMVLLAYYDGWSPEALSVYFDAPVPAVKTWIHRSASEIAACLTD